MTSRVSLQKNTPVNWLQIVMAIAPALATIGIIILQTGKVLNRIKNMEIRMDKFELRMDKIEERINQLDRRLNKLAVQVVRLAEKLKGVIKAIEK